MHHYAKEVIIGYASWCFMAHSMGCYRVCNSNWHTCHPPHVYWFQYTP